MATKPATTKQGPSALEEFDDLVQRARAAAREAGMKPADVQRAVAKVRVGPYPINPSQGDEAEA